MKKHDIDNLKFAWTAEVRLNNGLIIAIWWTCWPMVRNKVEIISIASDYPAYRITF